MIRMTAEKIAEAAMVGVAKVKKDITKGKLDSESLKDIVRYVQGHRMLAGGLAVWDGVMFCVAEAEDKPLLVDEPAESLWGGAELMVMREMIKHGRTKKEAEAAVKKMRAELGVQTLGIEDLEGLGI